MRWRWRIDLSDSVRGGRRSHSTVRAGEGARTVIAKHKSPKEIGESIDVSHVSFLSLALRLLEAPLVGPGDDCAIIYLFCRLYLAVCQKHIPKRVKKSTIRKISFHHTRIDCKNPIKSLCNSRDSPTVSFDHGAEIGSPADSGNGHLMKKRESLEMTEMVNAGKKQATTPRRAPFPACRRRNRRFLASGKAVA